MSHAMMIDVTLAVKNGPLGMWRALGPAGPLKPLSRFVASPLWLVATICVCSALAPSIYRATRDKKAPASVALLLAIALLGLFVTFDLLARGTGLPLVVFVLLAGALVAVSLRAGLRQTHPGTGRPADVVDLAHRRENRGARRRAGSR